MADAGAQVLRDSIRKALDAEALMLNCGVKYVAGWVWDGDPPVTVIVYEPEAIDVPDHGKQYQRRVATYIEGNGHSSSIGKIWWGE